MTRRKQQSSTPKDLYSTFGRVAHTLLHVTMLIALICCAQQTATAQTTMEVKPAFVQPDGILTLTFSKPVKVKTVKIGTVDATVVSPAPANTLNLTVPSTVGAGRQQITASADGEADALTGQVIVAPKILGLKGNKDGAVELSRVVLAEGEVLLQFSEKIPAEVREKLNVQLQETENQAITHSVPRWVAEDTYLILTLPEIPGDFWKVERKTFAVNVTAGGERLEKQTRLKILYRRWMYLWGSGVVLILIGLIYVLYKFYPRDIPNQRRYNFVKMLLLEPENQTYSLSRAQFLVWLLVIVWCYLFLYTAHGFVEQNWFFPNLGNSVYAFLISLGTLLASDITNRTMGVKGAGEFHPSIADLVVHGGVLALDRVQQIVWTLIAAGMFIRITVSTYDSATELPDIPAQLLTLMGLSSAGYLGGKLVRGPGPVIEQVTTIPGSVVLSIKGKHLSKDAFVWLDGVQQPKDNVIAKVDDPDDPVKFAKEVEVTLNITIDDWNTNAHAITVVNPDAQRADWRKAAGTTVGTAADTTTVGTGDTTTGTTGDTTTDTTTGATGGTTTGTTSDTTTGNTGDTTTGTTSDTTTGTTSDTTTGTTSDTTTGTTSDTTTGTTSDTDTETT